MHTLFSSSYRVTCHPDVPYLLSFLTSIPERFAQGEGKVIHQGRNELRLLSYGGEQFVVKSFHVPHWLNRLAYAYVRGSKAKRSYLYADRFRQAGIGSPQPIGYIEQRGLGGLAHSFYVSRLSACPYTYADLLELPVDHSDRDAILVAIGQATARMHELGYWHKDFSRGNILYGKQAGGRIQVEIIDLNRMRLGRVGLKLGCRNFERLPGGPHLHQVLAQAYAEVRGFDAASCYHWMQYYRSLQDGYQYDPQQ